MKTPAFCLFFVVTILFPAALEARSWKEAGSNRSLEGEYSRTEADQVVILRANGTSVKVPLEKLSDEDKKFVAEQVAAKQNAVTADVFKWETDLEVAKKRAKDEKKEILVDFTGSDWCGWCIRLKKEVFDQPEFQEYAKKHLIMVELDFPRKKKLPAKETAENEKLSQEFKVDGFPTVLLLNERGKEIGRTGYQKGGPANYVEHLKGLLK
ncbi:MAG TPA: thioredoxin family protein [Luteolibacter sp.]